ncbi:MAG: hypothetical protein ACKOPN_11950, partial [Prochlorococcaceae cyanobacterium]
MSPPSPSAAAAPIAAGSVAIAVLVERANERLARGGVGLRLELRGHRLGLRGPLPSLADPGRLQRRRLSLG